MPVGADVAVGFNRIQHPIDDLFRLVEIVVQAPTWVLSSLLTEWREQFLINPNKVWHASLGSEVVVYFV